MNDTTRVDTPQSGTRAEVDSVQGDHKQGCVLRDDCHSEPCLTALPPWYDPDCAACADIYCDPRYECEDLCLVECIGACGG